MDNVVCYLDPNPKTLDRTWTVGRTRGVGNLYTLDGPSESVVADLLSKIGPDTVYLVGSCKTGYGVCLLAEKLRSQIKNKIALVLFSPILTLRTVGYAELPWAPGHSMRDQLDSADAAAHDASLGAVFADPKVDKYIFLSEKDPNRESTHYRTELFHSSKSLVSIQFRDTMLHNIFALFWYGHSRNFNKLTEAQWYVPKRELLVVKEVWETCDFAKLMQAIRSGEHDQLRRVLDYHFIAIEKF
jgi:hypothetical protein